MKNPTVVFSGGEARPVHGAPQGNPLHETRLSCISGELQTTRDGALKSTEEPEERPEVGGIVRKPTSKSIVGKYRAYVRAQVHV